MASPPRATRPMMPGYGLAAADAGKGLLPWSWAQERLARARFAAEYKTKYDWDVSSMTEPVYVVRPRCVYGLIEESFTTSATRWEF